jgi:hypothetical protein
MHREHDPSHVHFHPHDHGADHGHSHSHGDGRRRSDRGRGDENGAGPASGHNAPGAAQWQTPHLHGGARRPPPEEAGDLDLIESAFCESFPGAGDALSFLRLAGVAPEGWDQNGARLRLLRVEQKEAVDVGALTPHVGGGSFRYDPLPGRMASRRKLLSFIYFDGSAVHSLPLSAARALASSPIDKGETS